MRRTGATDYTPTPNTYTQAVGEQPEAYLLGRGARVGVSIIHCLAATLEHDTIAELVGLHPCCPRLLCVFLCVRAHLQVKGENLCCRCPHAPSCVS